MDNLLKNRELPNTQTLIAEAISAYISSLREDNDEWNNLLADIVESATVFVDGEEI